MTRQEYVEQRKALVAEAEAYAKEGSRDKFDAKRQEIEALDNAYDEARKARANARAMKDQLADISGRTIGDDDVSGVVVDRTDDEDSRAFGSAARREVWRPSAKRGRELRAMNAVKLTSEGILTPTRYSDEISPTFNVVSGLVDRVRFFNRLGGESFEHSYIKGYGEGKEVADDANYHETDMEFGLVAIHKSKITAYSEVDEGVTKLPDADYDAEIAESIRIHLRRRLARQILVGSGGTNVLTGIFNSNYDSGNKTAGAIDPATDLEIDAITESTLDDFIFGYGGEEDVEDGAVLILNKLDLKAFAQLRDGNGNRIHTIRSNGNTGTIDGVDYIINSACKPISSATTQPGDYAMAFGHLSSYGLAIFSDIDIQRSTDYKFRSGQVAHRGSVYAGGNVIRWNGFLRGKKGGGSGEGEGEGEEI